MSTYVEGQRIEIRSDLTQAELVKFRELVGLLAGSQQRTIEILKMPATYICPSSSGASFFARFDGVGSWYIPNFLLITKPRNKEEQVLDKIKYLDNRFKQRKTLCHEH